MTIIATCPKCSSEDLTIPNSYRTKWVCRDCGARFPKAKMVRVADYDGDMLEAQTVAVGQMIEADAEAYLKR